MIRNLQTFRRSNVPTIPALATLFLLLFAASSAPAQGPATGTPPFGSFSGGPDIINNADLNAHLTIPVLHKPGRGGFNFTYDFSYDSSVWYPVGVSGNQTWQPVANGGWRGSTEVATGYISESTSTIICSWTTVNGRKEPNGWKTTISMICPLAPRTESYDTQSS